MHTTSPEPAADLSGHEPVRAEPSAWHSGPKGWFQVLTRRRLRWPDLVAGAVFAIAGALFIASAAASRDGTIRVDSTGGLTDTISARSEANGDLALQVDALTVQLAVLQEDTTPGSAIERQNERLAELSPAVGLTEVRGPGVTVTLDDATAPNPLPEDMTGDDYIVHQQDVQGVVNALWRGGASGLTVMGQRLVNSSAVRCVGNTVILQGQVYSPPFVIEAVGDVDRLTSSLDTDESVQFFRQWAGVVGMRYEMAAARSMVLPAYSGPLVVADVQVVS